MGYIDYSKFFQLLEKKGKNRQYLRNNGIQPRVIYKMERHEDLSTVTICQICELLNCQPKDIMEYVKTKPTED